MLFAWFVFALYVLAAQDGLRSLTSPYLAGQQAGTGKGALPGVLLGVRHGTGANARTASRQYATDESAVHRTMPHAAADVYGIPSRPWFLVAYGPCGNCMPSSAGAVTGMLTAPRHGDAQLFPAGPHGGIVRCYSGATHGIAFIDCSWADQRNAGDADFFGGFAASLPDAAAKTLQIRAAVEG
jgi:hypothetical protein